MPEISRPFAVRQVQRIAGARALPEILIPTATTSRPMRQRDLSLTVLSIVNRNRIVSISPQSYVRLLPAKLHFLPQ